MSPRREEPFRVLICGTTFGQVYLEALRNRGPHFRLAGILTRGSERSRACSEFYDVPLFTKVKELPPDIDLACVVVRGSLLGGGGSELAQSLMARGIHVLQEHPVHHDELAACLRQAHRSRVYYQLNSFYPHLASVRRFLQASQRLLVRRRALYVDAACSFQVGFALLDILRAVLGKVQPWGFAAAPRPRDGGGAEPAHAPFRSMDGMFAGVPLALRVQHQLDPADPDDNAYLLHRITLGTDAGELTLVGTHGPLIWSGRPAIPREVRDGGGTSLFGEGTVPDDDTSAAALGPVEEPSQRRLFRSMWPDAVGRALCEVRRLILDGEDPLRRGQQQLTLCRVWQDIAGELGPPQLVRSGTRTPPLSAAELAAMRAAAGEPEAEQL